MKVILYTIGCPNCNVLKRKLDEKNIDYESVTDEATIEQKGYNNLPVLEVEDSVMKYGDAIKWVNKQ